VPSFRASELAAALLEDLCYIDAHMRDITEQVTTAEALDRAPDLLVTEVLRFLGDETLPS